VWQPLYSFPHYHDNRGEPKYAYRSRDRTTNTCAFSYTQRQDTFIWGLRVHVYRNRITGISGNMPLACDEGAIANTIVLVRFSIIGISVADGPVQ